MYIVGVFKLIIWYNKYGIEKNYGIKKCYFDACRFCTWAPGWINEDNIGLSWTFHLPIDIFSSSIIFSVGNIPTTHITYNVITLTIQ